MVGREAGSAEHPGMRVKWGVLGASRFAERAIIPALMESALAIPYAIASRSSAAAAGMAARFHIPRHYGSYDELLMDEDVEIVYIPLPNALHARWAVAAARSGKHVLCEKPLAVTSKEAVEVLDACSASGVKIMEAFSYRYKPHLAFVRKLLEDESRREARLVQARFTIPLARMGDRVNDIRWEAELAGGSLMDLGCYCIDTGISLLGGDPTEAYCLGLHDGIHTAEVETHGMVSFSGGGLLTFCSSFLLEQRSEYTVWANGMRISVDGPYGHQASVPVSVTSDKGETTHTIPGVNEYLLEVDNFTRVVLGLDAPVVRAEETLATARVMDALMEANRRRRPVKICSMT